jgi:hypothetical protein
MKRKLMMIAALGGMWMLSLAVLVSPSGVPSAHATIDCEVFPEICDPPSCDNQKCQGSSGCTTGNGMGCSVNVPDESCKTSLCGQV